MARMSIPVAGYRLVPVPVERRPEFYETDHLAFGYEMDDETRGFADAMLPWDRAVALESAEGTLAAVHSSFPFALTVPGGAVPCAGLTWVGVRPDHRRRGLLTWMIAEHLRRSVERGEVASALYAAEPAIYGRFGYGLTGHRAPLVVPRRASLRDVPGSGDLTVRFGPVDPALHGPVVQRLHRAEAARPGWVGRDTAGLQAWAVADPAASRDGGEPMRIATVHAADGETRGYLLLRRTEKWGDGGPESVVTVREHAMLDAAAAHRLWSFVLDLDLTATVQVDRLASDDVLRQLLVDERRTTPRLKDDMWLRLLDVPAALVARRYPAPVDAVLGVRDALLPANAHAWRLRTVEQEADGAWRAEVERAGGEPEATLDVRDLSAVYLGGRSLAALHGAGLVEGKPGLALVTALGWPVAPMGGWSF